MCFEHFQYITEPIASDTERGTSLTSWGHCPTEGVELVLCSSAPGQGAFPAEEWEFTGILLSC